MDLPGRPAADLRTAMPEDLEQADDARLVDLEAGITHRADRDRMGEVLQQREIDMHVEPLGLEAGEAISTWKVVRTASRWSSPSRRPKSVRLLETNSLRRKVRTFSYCLRKPLLK